MPNHFHASLVLWNTDVQIVAEALGQLQRRAFVYSVMDDAVCVCEEQIRDMDESTNVQFGQIMTKIIGCHGISFMEVEDQTLWAQSVSRGSTQDIYVSDPSAWDFTFAKAPYGDARLFCDGIARSFAAETVDSLFRASRQRRMPAPEIHKRLMGALQLSGHRLETDFVNLCVGLNLPRDQVQVVVLDH